MLSINTNLSSLIAPNSLKDSTSILNQAVERMTTGYKINHAKDNAANYSISTNMQTQIQSYDVAADNVVMGMDLVTTASDIISNMQNKATRLQSLCIQARNGTYGAQSLAAINTEAGAIMAEINRLYNTAEYNGISLFDRKAYDIPTGANNNARVVDSPPVAKAENDGFIENPVTYTKEQIEAMTELTLDVDTITEGGEYAIYDANQLAHLASLVNSGKLSSINDVTFVLAEDIDLKEWCDTNGNWVPIGNDDDYITSFHGTFDGNGHTISNLKIDSTENYQGLFGCVSADGDEGWDNATIKNVALVDANVKGEYSVGGLVGYASAAYDGTLILTNNYAIGSVSGTDYVGGLVGGAYAYESSTLTLANNYATDSVSGTDRVGGLVGYTKAQDYSTLALTNNYATGSVTGQNQVGGLVGYAYAVYGTLTLANNYATGSVSGTDRVGGLVGYLNLSLAEGYETKIVDCASYSKSITGTESVGSLIGGYCGEDISGYYSPGVLTIENCSTISELSGIGGYYTYDDGSGDTTYVPDHDLSAYNEKVAYIPPKPVQTTLQVGIYSDDSCRISFDTNFEYDLSSLEGNLASDESYEIINNFLTMLSEKSTMLGAVENRLTSALESIEVNMNNLTSSLSTIRDADIAEVSSQYIQQQILQQAAATLLATVNQSPSIALQLI